MKNQTQSLFDDNYKPNQFERATRQATLSSPLGIVIIGAIAAIIVSGAHLVGKQILFESLELERWDNSCGCLPPGWEHEKFGVIETPCPEAVENQLAANDEPVGWWSIEEPQTERL